MPSYPLLDVFLPIMLILVPLAGVLIYLFVNGAGRRPLAERRRLRSIERVITAADPALTDRFAMFSEHYRGQAMPRTERLTAREVRRAARAEMWLGLWLGM
jgi:hypothetical protein